MEVECSPLNQSKHGARQARNISNCPKAVFEVLFFMHKTDTLDVQISLIAVVADAIGVFCGFMLATWIRFHSGWVPFFHGNIEPSSSATYVVYARGAAYATCMFLVIFRSLQLYVRPQLGRFENKIPRIIRGVSLGIVASIVAAFIFQNLYVKISTVTFMLSFVTISAVVVLERYVLFRIELHYAKHSTAANRVLILGTDEVAAHLMRGMAGEPQLRSKVVGFLRTDLTEQDKDIPPDLIIGTIEELSRFIEEDEEGIHQVILTDSKLNHDRIVDILLLCERNLVTFKLVPDIFHILTGSMDVQTIDDIPLLGVSHWPLDLFWNRVLKRTEDIAGGLTGLILCAPIIAVAAVCIKRDSPGPVFFRQERCGEKGKSFTLYKLRTMRVNAEDESGPVWTSEDDPRRTTVGAFLRRHNLDEIPQLWNVLKGDMSLIGPRPERPHFVEQFKEDIGRYMWRHVSKPGVTGWAQVNGLRGNTSITERVKYDLYYLEEWSLAFDFKILLKTLFAKTNAY